VRAALCALAMGACQAVPPPAPVPVDTLALFNAAMQAADKTCGPVAWDLSVTADGGIRFLCGRPAPIGRVAVPKPKIAEVP
jgi:hypothetical protein